MVRGMPTSSVLAAAWVGLVAAVATRSPRSGLTWDGAAAGIVRVGRAFT